jgi:hypothetical protein
MRIIECDLHARQQTLAMLDTTMGEILEVTLKHGGDNVREFYSSFASNSATALQRLHWRLLVMDD